MSSPDRAQSTALLEELLSIRSLSGAESEASEFLAHWLGEQGLEHCRVDEVGNAVGELGEPGAARIVVLLGHIDTVAGDVPVERRCSKEGEVLYGRGSVDAKGPLAAFCAAAARLGSDWAREQGVRVLVVGAVEEEATTSRGARHRDHHSSRQTQQRPHVFLLRKDSLRLWQVSEELTGLSEGDDDAP